MWCGRFSKPCGSAAIRDCSNMRGNSTVSTRKSVRVPAAELDAPRRTGLTPSFSAAVEVAASQHSPFRREATARRNHRLTFGTGLQAGADCPAARYGRPLHSVGPLSAAFHADDDGGSGAGGGRDNICVACPKPVDEVYGTAHLLGHRSGVSDGRRAGYCGFCFWHEDGSARGSDCRSRATSMWRRRRSCWRVRSASILWPDRRRF